MSAAQGNWYFRGVISFVEWVLKKSVGPTGWRPAGAVQVLPPAALVHDTEDEARADEVFEHLARLGFSPRKVAVDSLGGTTSEVGRRIADGTRGCWATVLLEPGNDVRARQLGPAFRRYAHRYPDVVDVVVGPLPSRSEILDRYRHVVTADDGRASAHDLAAGIAHASALRVIHTARLINMAVVVFSAAAVLLAVVLAWLGWLFVR